MITLLLNKLKLLLIRLLLSYIQIKKSDIDIDFATNTKSDDLVTISTDKGNISWEYAGTKKSVAKIKNNNKKHKDNEKYTSIDKLSSQANYNSIYTNVDLNCIVSSTGVKENIILNSSDAQNEFEIDYNIKGLKAKQTDEKLIVKGYKNTAAEKWAKKIV